MTTFPLSDQPALWSRYQVIYALFARDVMTPFTPQVSRYIRAQHERPRSKRGVSAALRSYSGGLWWEQQGFPWTTD